MNTPTTRRVVLTTAATVATGSIATRLARLEGALGVTSEPDGGDALVIVIEDPVTGERETRGIVGEDSLVILLTYRQDGPQ